MKTVWIILGLAAAGGAIWYLSKKKGLAPMTSDSGQDPGSAAAATTPSLLAPSLTTPPIVVTTPEQQEAAQVVKNIVQMAELSKVTTQPSTLAPPPSPSPLEVAAKLKEKLKEGLFIKK